MTSACELKLKYSQSLSLCRAAAYPSQGINNTFLWTPGPRNPHCRGLGWVWELAFLVSHPVLVKAHASLVGIL